jgi:hypothetical protein
MSLKCRWLHELVHGLPELRWPFTTGQLPEKGIYFFLEEGETWGHGGNLPRIVRVGSHKNGNFRPRIGEHYVEDRKLVFGANQPAPKDRSIFRKNIGRALLRREHDPYEVAWEIDRTPCRGRNDGTRVVEKEMALERNISSILRNRFTLRSLEVTEEGLRLGQDGLEKSFIGTLAKCGCCHSSPGWLGRHSPKAKIAESGLWLEQHLRAPEISDSQIAIVEGLVARPVRAA